MLILDWRLISLVCFFLYVGGEALAILMGCQIEPNHKLQAKALRVQVSLGAYHCPMLKCSRVHIQCTMPTGMGPSWAVQRVACSCGPTPPRQNALPDFSALLRIIQLEDRILEMLES